MNSQCRVINEIAGRIRRRANRGGQWATLLQRCRLAAVTVVLILAILPGELQAQQGLALVNATHVARVNVTLGKSEDVRTDQGLVDISLGDPTVADVNPLTDHALSILGKKIGTTRVTVYGENKKPVGIFDVEVSYDITRLSAEIRQLSGGGIRVSAVNGRILLSGTAADAVTLDKAVMIARQFVPDPIDTVQVMRPQQIMLEVRFIEVSRSASRELGVQWNIFGSHVLANVGSQLPVQQLPITAPGGAFQQPAAAGSGIGGASVLSSGTTGTPLSPVVAAGVLSGAAPFGFLVSQLGSSVQMEINALEQKGLARSLAEPNLVALSGDTASFLAGGQFPVPEANGLGTVTFAYQPYGVGLSFTPTVLRDGLINLVIKPEVSEIDTAHTVTVAGTSVPGLITRKASTTLELRDGQSFMLGGLLQNQTTTAQEQLPWVGDVPVLGALFRSSMYQKNETDLVILVTPHLVNPVRPTNVAHSPLDNTLPANDVDFFLNGKAEVSPAFARLAFGAPNRPYVGHILDLPKKGGAYVVSVKD
ncbi:MAG: type II and III secretion system protein family protein [Xanthobacteraceae bacterium]|nr:type II and III secretion system protein family protein [Xanthobacteraceae bacterium]